MYVVPNDTLSNYVISLKHTYTFHKCFLISQSMIIET